MVARKSLKRKSTTKSTLACTYDDTPAPSQVDPPQIELPTKLATHALSIRCAAERYRNNNDNVEIAALSAKIDLIKQKLDTSYDDIDKLENKVKVITLDFKNILNHNYEMTELKRRVDLETSRLSIITNQNIEFPPTSGLLHTLRLGELVAYGRIAGPVSVTRIATEEWEGDWTFCATTDSAERRHPYFNIMDIKFLRKEDTSVPKRSQGGRPTNELWKEKVFPEVTRLAVERGKLWKTETEFYESIRKEVFDKFCRELEKSSDSTIKENYIRLFGENNWAGLFS